jgi:hypothetical protein
LKSWLAVRVCGLMVLVGGAGCASIMRGKNQGMRFETDPPGATVAVTSDGQPSGKTYTTPAKVELRRSKEHRVLIAREGYQPVTFVLRPNWDGASLPGFVLPGGSLSLGADRASGADLAFYPLPKIKLTPATGPSSAPVELHQYRTQLLNDQEYERALKEEERYEREMRQQ